MIPAEFTCRHIIKQPQDKLTLFDPTPPLQAAQKVIEWIRKEVHNIYKILSTLENMLSPLSALEQGHLLQSILR